MRDRIALAKKEAKTITGALGLKDEEAKDIFKLVSDRVDDCVRENGKVSQVIAQIWNSNLNDKQVAMGLTFFGFMRKELCNW